MVNYFKINKNKRLSLPPFKQGGFTLIETLVAVAIFVMVSVAIYSAFVSILKIMNVIRIKGIMTNIANEQFEIVRNLPYANVGTINGIPSGILPQSQIVDRDNKSFTIETTIRNVDEPFDGTFDGTPKDLSPADMKMIEVNIICNSCESTFSPIAFTTKIAPKNLETASVNGALVIKVFDASGLPVASADVTIINNSVTPNINLNDSTNVDGLLTIVDAPPSVEGYQITVTKDGYSTDRTYPVGGSGNPNPIKPNVTVVVQQISQVSFTIDKTSTVNVSTVNNLCVATPNFDFNISGIKLIGTDPDTLKYNNASVTNGLGKVALSLLEWDVYNILGTDGARDIIGTNPLLSLGVNPDIEQDLEIITAPKNGRRLLVVVRDYVTGLPITDATVTLTGPNDYSKSIVTSEGFLTQSDWSGGGGQEIFEYPDMYLASDGNIDDSSSPGELKLKKFSSDYANSGDITSSTFDIGGVGNFRQIIWSPATQPIETGETSVKMQIATNNDNLTWNFVGPDGTAGTYYTSSNQNINVGHNGDRYIRYRLYLSTLDTLFTPTISDISFTYTSACIPPGQVSFTDLLADTYTILVEKTDYQSVSKNVTILNNWTKEELTISQ